MRILCFTPLAGRTGSELVLDNILRYADRDKVNLAVACRQEGEMLSALPADVPGFVYSYPPERSLPTKVRDVLHYRVGGDTGNRLIKEIHEKFKPDLWYVNTIMQPEVVRQARDYGVPCAVHSHELEQMFVHLSETDIQILIDYPKLLIASSQAVERTLRILGRESGMEICYEMVSIGNIRSDAAKSKAIRRGLGVTDDTFVWAMSGTLDLNKDPVMFVDVANEVLKGNQRAHFIWLGGAENGYSYFAKKKAEFLKISEQISWLGARGDDYYDYLNASDGFVLVSRRDCFPLVMIEAAALGKPIASFNSGGIKEFVQDGMGIVVNSWNLTDLSQVMLRTMNRAIDFQPQVAQARAREYDAQLQVRHWESMIGKYFS